MLFQSPRRQFVRANGNSAAPAATWPATTLAGSTLLMFLVIDFAGTNTTITPPGTWVQVNITAGTTQMRVVGYKIENAGARSGTETFALGVAKAWGVILVELIGSGVVDISGIANDDTANLAFSRLSGASATQPDAYSIAVVGNQGTAAAQSIDASYVYWTQLFNDTTPNLGVGVYEYVATSILAGAADIIGALSASARDAVMTVVVKITSPTPALQRLFRQEISTKLDSLRGSLGIYLRIKPNAQDEWRFTVKWTPSLGVANLALPAIIRSWRTAPTFSAWVEIKIGSIRVPEQGGLAGVVLELWTERVSTSIKGADLNPGGAAINPFRLDSLILVPEDDTASLINTKGETQKWLGSELVTPVVSPGSGTAGVIVGSEMQLNTPTTDNAGTRPNSGVAFPAGVHRFIFKLRHDTTNPTITLAIRNITDGNDTAVQTLILSSTFMTISMLVTLVTGKSYQAQVRAPSMVATASIFVQSIERTFVPTLVSGQAAMTDAGSDPPFAHVVDASDNILASLALDGPLPDMLEPGLNLINVAVFDPAALGFDEPESVLSRTGTLAVAHAPRFFE